MSLMNLISNIFQLQVIIKIVLTMLLSIIFHEYGHYLYYYINDSKPRIKFSFKSWRNISIKVIPLIPLKRKKALTMFSAGILFGIVPIIFSSIIFSGWYYLLLPIYMIGCKSDLNKIQDIVKEDLEAIR